MEVKRRMMIGAFVLEFRYMMFTIQALQVKALIKKGALTDVFAKYDIILDPTATDNRFEDG